MWGESLTSTLQDWIYLEVVWLNRPCYDMRCWILKKKNDPRLFWGVFEVLQQPALKSYQSSFYGSQLVLTLTVL
jgi:hypothetical protein